MKNTPNKFAAFCIAGTSSGDGKTTITLALMRALTQLGMSVQPYKCGPDYIDPAFHKYASGNTSVNLDGWMMGTKTVKKSFARSCQDCDCAIIEGVMGLFDSSRPNSISGSTAEIAISLNIPTILVVNAKGMANSIAALVSGYVNFNNKLNIIGVIANKVGSEHHANILQQSLEAAALPPLLGYLTRDDKWQLPERHLGLVPIFENKHRTGWFNALGHTIKKSCNLEKILNLSQVPRPACHKQCKSQPTSKIRLGIAYDKAFNFYYKDNLDILQDNGFELIKFSPIFDAKIPASLDAIYIGGGFPEVFAKELSKNETMLAAIREFHNSGKFIYAECGGYMYLTKELQNGDETFPMCGLINATAKMGSRMHSLGYREVSFATDKLQQEFKQQLRGHEFHWSNLEFFENYEPLWLKTSPRNATPTACGIMHNNLFASYIHLHFGSCHEFIPFIKAKLSS